MVCKFQWKPFWLATQLYAQNDWTGWQNGVNDDVCVQAHCPVQVNVSENHRFVKIVLIPSTIPAAKYRDKKSVHLFLRSPVALEATHACTNISVLALIDNSINFLFKLKKPVTSQLQTLWRRQVNMYVSMDIRSLYHGRLRVRHFEFRQSPSTHCDES